VFEAKDVLARVEKMGDLFEPVQKLKQKLPQLSGLLAESEREDNEGISLAAQAEAAPPAKTTNKMAKGKAAAGKRRKL
jgi:hypothetical protein